MITIPPLSQQALGPSLDHRFLKEEARRKVEKLAGKSWTDYNTHDPGITILELLAYAITDLGLRTKLEIADLIARGEERPFFTAREALPTATYTASDYRCLLIDRPYIRNAFVERTPGSLNGLNDLLLDLEPFAEEGLEEPLELQEVWLRGIPIDLGANTYEFYVVFPYWEDLPELWTGNLNLLEVNISAAQEADDPEKDVFDLFFVEPFFVFGNEDDIVHLEDMGLFIRLPKGIPKLDPDNNELNGFKTAVVDQLNQNITFFQQYQKRVRRRAERLEMAKAFVFEHRNLCEDCQNIDTIRIQQIGLNIQELVLKADADPEEVVARIFFLIDLFIDPQVQAQSFEALLAEDRTAAEIFDGPLLENGFLLKEKLPDLEREDKIYTSDLGWSKLSRFC